MKYVLFFTLSVFLLSCKTDKKNDLSAQQIVDKAIKAAGGQFINSSTIEFDFRDKTYRASRNEGQFELERFFTDSTSVEMSKVRDILSNDGFKRLVDDKEIEVIDSMKVKYAASVNSVHYFSVLPFGLNDKAVNKKRLNDILIKGEKYHVIEVTFNENGGGEDYEDVFLYWINTKTFKTEYLAYSYNENDGKGLRFREAYNERFVNNIRFVDYNNYKPKSNLDLLSELPKLFEKAQLKLLSKIELENIKVN